MSKGRKKATVHPIRPKAVKPIPATAYVGGEELPELDDVMLKPRIVELLEKPKIMPDDRLLAMHTYMRPHGSVAEAEFINRFIATVDGIERDEFGNWSVQVGDVPVLWSAHTDTVHHADGRQQVALRYDGRITASGGSCLGADDGAGCYVLLRMIEAKVPGLYVFHRGEERGCLGSRWIAEHRAQWLTGIKAAVAFDRKGTDEVITHQRGDRSASDEFAASLAAAIGMKHKPSSKGVYTDTASYTEIIGECSNVGVGYENAHGSSEWLDGGYVMELAEAMCAIGPKLGELVFKRQPGETEKRVFPGAYPSYKGYAIGEGYGREWGWGGRSVWGTHDEPLVLKPGEAVPTRYAGYVQGYVWRAGSYDRQTRVYTEGMYVKVAETCKGKQVDLFASDIAGKYGDTPTDPQGFDDLPFAILGEAIDYIEEVVIEEEPAHELVQFCIHKLRWVIDYLRFQGCTKVDLKKFVMLCAKDRALVLALMDYTADDLNTFMAKIAKRLGDGNGGK